MITITLGGVLAEVLARHGHVVRLVTPAPLVSSWTAHTLEIGDIQRRVREAGIIVDVSRVLVGVGAGEARTACAFTGSEASVPADAVLLVTARLPRDDLFLALHERQGEWSACGVNAAGPASSCSNGPSDSLARITLMLCLLWDDLRLLRDDLCDCSVPPASTSPVC